MSNLQTKEISGVIKNKKKDSYFDSKSVKEMLDEMD